MQIDYSELCINGLKEILLHTAEAEHWKDLQASDDVKS